MSALRAPGAPSAWLFDDTEHAAIRRAAVLCLLPALVFSATLAADFVFDDNLVVLAEESVAGPRSLVDTLRHPVQVGHVVLGYYRPLIEISYLVDRALWGLNPAGYHLTNLLWHLFTTWLVYRLSLRTLGGRPAALLAGLFFGLLPIHTEAVGWVQGRVDLISAGLALLTLLALLASRAVSGRSSLAYALGAGAVFFLALTAKESVAILPLAWLVWELQPLPAGPRVGRAAAGLRLGALVAAGLGYGLLRQAAMGGLAPFPTGFAPFGLRLTAALLLWGSYLRGLVWPGQELRFFSGLEASLSGAGDLASLALGLLGLVGLGILWRTGRRLFPWAAFAGIMLLPALALVFYARAPEVGFLTADRFLYLPSVGWCILLGVAAERLGVGRTGGMGWEGGSACAALLLVGYAGLTMIRLVPWMEPVDFYRAMQAQPRLSRSTRALVHNNLGQLYLERDDLVAAQAELEAALRVEPDHPAALNNLGVVLIRAGRPAQARPFLEAAIRLDPAYADAYGNLGAAHEAEGDRDAARRAYEAGLRLRPGAARLLDGLARVSGALPDAPAVRRMPSR